MVTKFNINQKFSNFSQDSTLDSYTDKLTKLPNRNYFEESIGDFINKNTLDYLPLEKDFSDSDSLTALMIDIDNFKEVNDCFGHKQGDIVLNNIGRLLNDSVINGILKYKTDIIAARTGGEEFTILIKGTSDKNSSEIAEELAANFHLELANKNSLVYGCKDFSLRNEPRTVSIGQYDYKPNDLITSNNDNSNNDIAMNIKRKLSETDIALYGAKNLGGNQTVKYNETIEKERQNIDNLTHIIHKLSKNYAHDIFEKGKSNQEFDVFNYKLGEESKYEDFLNVLINDPFNSSQEYTKVRDWLNDSIHSACRFNKVRREKNKNKMVVEVRTSNKVATALYHMLENNLSFNHTLGGIIGEDLYKQVKRPTFLAYNQK
jgi:diguanylate cyclase (GGDEF)-like protein